MIKLVFVFIINVIVFKALSVDANTGIVKPGNGFPLNRESRAFSLDYYRRQSEAPQLRPPSGSPDESNFLRPEHGPVKSRIQSLPTPLRRSSNPLSPVGVLGGILVPEYLRSSVRLGGADNSPPERVLAKGTRLFGIDNQPPERVLAKESRLFNINPNKQQKESSLKSLNPFTYLWQIVSKYQNLHKPSTVITTTMSPSVPTEGPDGGCSESQLNQALTDVEAELDCNSKNFCSRYDGRSLFVSQTRVNFLQGVLHCVAYKGKVFIPKTRFDNERMLLTYLSAASDPSVNGMWYPVTVNFANDNKLEYWDGMSLDMGSYYKAFEFVPAAANIDGCFFHSGVDNLGDRLGSGSTASTLLNFMCHRSPVC